MTVGVFTRAANTLTGSTTANSPFSKIVSNDPKMTISISVSKQKVNGCSNSIF